MASLSLCMIVKDEEDFLEQCLNSIKDFVDEIIIVDTGSTDKTIDIAKRFTDKVYQIEWPNDFSKARNISLKYATKEWILVLDADEIISDEDLQEIKGLIKNKDIDGFVFTQRNYTDNSAIVSWISCGEKNEYTKKFEGYVPTRLIRLFRNKDFEFRNKVHELVEYSIKEKGGKVKKTDIQIHHYADNKSEVIKENKTCRYFELGKKIIKECPNDARAYYQTGVFCLNKKDYKKAVEKFKRVIELDPNYMNIYYNLGSAYHSLNKLDEAEINLKKSIEKKPKLNSAYNLLGIIYQKQERYQEAIDILFKGIKINKSDLLLQTLGGLYVKLGIYDKAIKCLNIALKINPNNIGILTNLGGVYVGLKNFEEAIEILNQIIKIDNQNFNVHKNLAFVHIQKKDNQKAVEQLNKMIEIFPEQKELIQDYLKTVNNN